MPWLYDVFVLALLASSLGSHWGEVPKTREAIQLSYEAKDTESVEVRIQSQSLGRLTLDITINRDVVLPGAKRYTVEGDNREQHDINSKCHFRGTVRDKPEFRVIFSSCSGRLRGSIIGQETTWYVLYHEQTYVMFSEADLPNPLEIATAEHNGVQLNHSYSNPLHPVFKRDVSKRDVSVSSKTLEVVVVTDRSMWLQFDTKVADVEEFVLATLTFIDEIYKPYGIRVALVGMENWRVADLITVTPSYAMTLKNFTMYRQEKLLNVYKQHDVSVLMTGVDFDGPVVGYAGVDTMCRSSCSNVNFNSRSNAKFFSSVISHEIGHNFGMYHDSEECVCPPADECLMSATMGVPVSTFSNCSLLVLNSFSGTCLNNQPKSLYGDPVCGNGFVEDGEECDCGSVEECIFSDPCCESTGCKLKPKAECYSGECCEECKFVSYKEVCRPASSGCDLVEFCTGTNSQCPTNRYTQDGTGCGGGAGFCNYGSCQTRDGQCTSLWGEGVQVSAPICYERYNKKGEWYGNCGSLGDRKYLACTGADVMCGKLYCEVPEERKAQMRNVYRSNMNYNESYTCTLASAARSSSSDNNDIAMVYDGTKCGDSRWCRAGQCVEFEKVPCPSPGDVECGGHGFCNDLNQCHCKSGYDPEFNCSVLLKVAGWDIKKIVTAVMIVVLVVIPLVIAAVLILRRYNPRVRTFFDHHTQIRFSVHLPSLSRRPSYLRKMSRRNNSGSSTNGKTTNNKTGSKQPAGNNPPPRPVKLPSTSTDPPARPPGSYRTSTGWVTSSFSNTDGGTRPLSGAAAPPRPASTYLQSSGATPSSSVYYSTPYKPDSGQPATSNYTPLSMHPTRPAPTRPPAPSTRPTSDSYESPLSKRGPKAFQATTRDNVKLHISGPESARKLLDDRPLDDRTLAGSPLRDLLVKR